MTYLKTERSQAYFATMFMLLLACLSGTATSAMAGDLAPSEIVNAQDAYSAGAYGDAVDILDDARLSQSRDRAAAAMLLCQSHLKLNNPEDALEACDQAVSSGRFGWAARNNRGLAHWLSGHPAEALVDLRVAADRAPSDASARQNLAVIEAAVVQSAVL